MFDFWKTKYLIDKVVKRDFIDAIIGLQEVRDGFAINKEWNVIAFLTLNGFDLDLASDQETDNVMRKLLDFFDTRISCPISFNITNTRNDLSDHNKIYASLINKSTTLTENTKRKLIMINELDNYACSKKYNIPEKKYVVTLSYKVDLKLNSSVILKNLNTFNFLKDEEWEKIKRQLMETVQQFIHFMNNGTNLGFRMMTEKEIYTYFKNVYSVGKYKNVADESIFLM